MLQTFRQRELRFSVEEWTERAPIALDRSIVKTAAIFACMQQNLVHLQAPEALANRHDTRKNMLLPLRSLPARETDWPIKHQRIWTRAEHARLEGLGNLSALQL